MKLVSIVGARPQFIKIAPLLRSFERHNDLGLEQIESIIVHTGQHYDVSMSDVFFDQLGIPQPQVNLGVGSGCHGSQTGQMLERIEKILLETCPDMVVIYGDTNSTLAGALAAVKLHIAVAHVEAGPRSFNRQMPEEINRIVADHVSDLLLAPTPTTMENLKNEGLSDKAVLSGDIMYDAVLSHIKLAERQSDILERLGLLPHSYGLVTVHRAENTDNEDKLQGLFKAFNDIAARAMRLVFPIHPRTAKRLQSGKTRCSVHPRLDLIEPVGYLDMLCLVRNAQLTLTDSGGLQKEAFFLGCPCITLRDETEWLETIHERGNILAGVDPARIFAAVSNWQTRFLAGRPDFSASAAASFGGGRAADRIKDALLAFHQTREKSEVDHFASLESTVSYLSPLNQDPT
jgi:UDP-GlcNAc3NAcA epimerase